MSQLTGKYSYVFESKHVLEVISHWLFWHLGVCGLQIADTPPVPWSKNNYDWSKIDSEQLSTAEKTSYLEKKWNVQMSM